LAAAEAVFILDSSAIIALIEDEPGANRVAALLEDKSCRFILHAIHACEVFYDRLRRGPPEDPRILESMLLTSGIEVDPLIPYALWQEAGRLKARLRRVSLADCFGLALTLREGGTFVSTDHHELDPVHAAGVCPIHFIR
jgi:uncharacterized protein with PIN domain